MNIYTTIQMFAPRKKYTFIKTADNSQMSEKATLHWKVSILEETAYGTTTEGHRDKDNIKY